MCVCVCVCVYEHIHTCMYMHIYMYIYIYIHLYTWPILDIRLPECLQIGCRVWGFGLGLSLGLVSV